MREKLALKLNAHGLHLRGILSLSQQQLDQYQIESPQKRSIALIGNIGPSYWSQFTQSSEYSDQQPNPLDRWSKRIAEQLASEFDAIPIFPFEGPPYYPFLQWAQRAEALSQSSMGLTIHPEYGLWHAYRFGLLIATQPQDEQLPANRHSPCSNCEQQPCLHTCPVNAFTEKGYQVDQCATYLEQNPNAPCHQQGCIARLACPEGKPFRYPPAQLVFHLRAFMSAR